MEGDVGFWFGAGGVEEGGAEDVHALDVDAGFVGAAGFGGCARAGCGGECGYAGAGGLLHVCLDWVCVLEFGAAEVGGGVG